VPAAAELSAVLSVLGRIDLHAEYEALFKRELIIFIATIYGKTCMSSSTATYLPLPPPGVGGFYITNSIGSWKARIF
jgi:hypothetical protein